MTKFLSLMAFLLFFTGCLGNMAGSLGSLTEQEKRSVLKALKKSYRAVNVQRSQAYEGEDVFASEFEVIEEISLTKEEEDKLAEAEISAAQWGGGDIEMELKKFKVMASFVSPYDGVVLTSSGSFFRSENDLAVRMQKALAEQKKGHGESRDVASIKKDFKVEKTFLKGELLRETPFLAEIFVRSKGEKTSVEAKIRNLKDSI